MNLRNGKLKNSAQPIPKRRYNKKMVVRPVQGVIRIPHKVQEQERQIRLPLKEHGMQRVQMDRDLQIIPRLCLKIIQGPQGLFQFQCRQPHPHPQAQRTYCFPRQMLQTICLVKARILLSNGDQILHMECHTNMEQAYEGQDLYMPRLTMRHFHRMLVQWVEVHTTLVFLPRYPTLPQITKQHFDKKWMQATMIC